jgi:hypothetical protein
MCCSAQIEADYRKYAKRSASYLRRNELADEDSSIFPRMTD